MHSAHAALALRMPTPEYDQPKIKCNECEAGFERRALLRVHLEEAHAMYLCTTLYCEDYFVSELVYADHYAANHACGQFHCEECDKTFTHRSKYNEHMIVHTAEMDKKRYHCDWPDCDNMFTHERDLFHHRVGHTGPSHVCKECGKMYDELHHLKQHMLTHKEPSIECVHCDEKCLSYKQRACHIAKAHSD